MTAVLEVDNVSVSYGDLHALREVSFSVEPGSVTGLIGPNGAGKTTLLDVISGFVKSTSGGVTLDGRRVDDLNPHRRARAGISRMFQSVDLFDDMTVAENLAVAAEAKTAGGTDPRRAAEIVGIDPVDRRLAGALSLGEHKRVALARALTSQPRVLLLDEPAAGLDQNERVELSAMLQAVAKAGISVVLVDHDLSLVLDTCDRVVVLDFGRVIADGEPAAIRNDPAVMSAYVGTVGAASRVDAPEAGQPGLSVHGLSAGYGGPPVVTDLDLAVAAGEIVALLGPNGAGKTTTLLALSGALPRSSGDVRVRGHQLQQGAHRQAAAGVAHVVQGRGVFTGLTTRENLRLVDRTGDATEEVLKLLPALRPLLRTPAGRLSGGEQQMLALARALAARPRLLIIDELSLGLAPKVVTQLLTALADRARESAMAVLLAEQHAAIALSVATRAYVMAAGRVVDAGPASEFAADPQRLAAAYLGGRPESGP
jgi:branched-chain amino acid transport system ATP-binding protein